LSVWLLGGFCLFFLGRWVAVGLYSAISCPVRAAQVLNDALTTRPFRHDVWHTLLTRYTTAQGEVDFVSLRLHPGRLTQYLAQLELISPENHPDYFPRPGDALAYWLNAHNALALRIALNHYPIVSDAAIRDADFPSEYRLGGRRYSLRALRERLLTRYYAFYPQMLFAFTNYTRSAPPVFPQAYDGGSLPGQLGAAARLALRDAGVIRFTRVAPRCPAIEMSAYWKDYESFWMGGWTHWSPRLKCFAPRELYADWERPCAHVVRYRPPDHRLRQTKPV
jgi:hypothetical protein